MRNTNALKMVKYILERRMKDLTKLMGRTLADDEDPSAFNSEVRKAFDLFNSSIDSDFMDAKQTLKCENLGMFE